MRAIEASEVALKQAQASQLPALQEAKIYSNLGELYRYAGWFSKSEDAMNRATSVLRSGPPAPLADQIGRLAVLHLEMNEPRQAEKEIHESLRLRETVEDPAAKALAQCDLAAIYVRQRQFKRAIDVMKNALEVLDHVPEAKPGDRMAGRQTMAFALLGLHDFNTAIPLLKESVDLANAANGPDSLLVGQAEYLLGDAYWQAGDLDRAADYMERGVDAMRLHMGRQHPVFVQSVEKYARLLRQRGQNEAAGYAEREVRQATQVVDARAFTPTPQ